MISSASGSIESRANSSTSTVRLRAPTSLQADCAYRSPTVSSGVRTFARTTVRRSSFAAPPSKSFMIGMRRPSSYTSRDSAERIFPPMSAAWHVFAKNAIGRPARKTGVTTVMSLIWPLVCHGSFVSSTSPGRSVSGGYAVRKCRTPVAIALMWPGVPVSDCATMKPRESKTPHARSSDSRTTVENAVRISAACCSFTIDTSRFASTSTRIVSIRQPSA